MLLGRMQLSRLSHPSTLRPQPNPRWLLQSQRSRSQCLRSAAIVLSLRTLHTVSVRSASGHLRLPGQSHEIPAHDGLGVRQCQPVHVEQFQPAVSDSQRQHNIHRHAVRPQHVTQCCRAGRPVSSRHANLQARHQCDDFLHSDLSVQIESG